MNEILFQKSMEILKRATRDEQPLPSTEFVFQLPPN